MIKSIHKRVNTAWQPINTYLPSKDPLKLAAKVTAASVAAFAAMEVGYYYYFFSVPWQIPFEKVSILEATRRVFKKIQEDGIFSNFREGIVWCSWTYCAFHPKVDPWYAMLKNDYLSFFQGVVCKKET